MSKFSKLPMRQLTELSSSSHAFLFSKLPMRQLTIYHPAV